MERIYLVVWNNLREMVIDSAWADYRSAEDHLEALRRTKDDPENYVIVDLPVQES